MAEATQSDADLHGETTQFGNVEPAPLTSFSPGSETGPEPSPSPGIVPQPPQITPVAFAAGESNHEPDRLTTEGLGDATHAGPAGSLSPSSSASSFVPIDAVQDAIQLIDEHKQFHQNVLEYIEASEGLRADREHRIVAVFGLQLTGKLTLLNALFHTNFGVMDEVNRQQTTKGIWLAHSPSVSCSASEDLAQKSSQKPPQDSILVMDVEGTDGRERGEDQDFERKAALFAMATSEVLIVNLWETQVGLYQGANMGLLKTVFEVNLSLFGKAKLDARSDHKVLLLFVIRDHLGVTPKESLAATITQDLLKIWDSFNKSADIAHLAFDNFFDLAFHTLSHKVLQHEKFMADVRLLGDRFVNKAAHGYLFKPYYHHNIPIEAWTMYAEKCWEQIDSNKDLDLPTQQILVAKFKCDEIAAACFAEFLLALQPHLDKAGALSAESGLLPDPAQVHADLTSLRDETLAAFDALAVKYNASVYEQRRVMLRDKINALLAAIVDAHARELVAASVKLFVSGLSRKARSGTFVETVTALRESTTTDFSKHLALLSLSGEINTNSHAELFEHELAKITAKQQVAELNLVVNKHIKKLGVILSTALAEELANPTPGTWDHIEDKFQSANKAFLSKYTNDAGDVDFQVGCDGQLNRHAAQAVEFKSWDLLHRLVRKYFSKKNVLNALKERFDDKFRYDVNGLPRFYKNARELEDSFCDAKSHATRPFAIMTQMKLSDGSALVPAVELTRRNRRRFDTIRSDAGESGADDDEAGDSDDSESEDGQTFAELLNERERAEVMAKFKREADTKFVETKRSILQHVTQIPYYIYIVILVLGWNEFMAVLRNPLFFTLLLVFGAGGYVMYQMNMLRPALIVVQRVTDEAISVAKEKVREYVLEDERPKRAESPEAESIEMDDL